MTLDERVARLEERTELIMNSLREIQCSLEKLDSRLDKLGENMMYVKAKTGVDAKTSVGISSLVVAFWEILKRIAGI